MWSFPKSGFEDSNKSSKLDEFFNSQNATTSVVRESLQNSLDAGRKDKVGPVEVHFILSEHEWSDMEPFAQTLENGLTLNHHTNSEDLGKFAEDFAKKKLRCLAIEDFNTDGLNGDTDKDKARSGSNFVGFWWNEGITGKARGTSGSHGVGKTTLTRVSNMSTFWALTKRSDDDRVFLLGFSNLPFHHVDGKNYLGHGRFGRIVDDGANKQFMPVEAEEDISHFSEVFGIDRSGYGLSVVIPAVDQTVQHRSIIEAVLGDYYWPILKGDLVVEVTDRITGKHARIDAGSVNTVMDQIDDEKIRSRLLRLIERARTILAMRGHHPNYFQGVEPELVTTSSGATKARLTAKCFSPENLERMKHQFENGNWVGVSFSVMLEPIDGNPVRGIFEVFLEPDRGDEFDRATQFIRNKIIISDQRAEISAKFGSCFVIVEDTEMSDYLKLAEEPAHTRWFITHLNKQKEFKSDWPLRFAMSAAAELHRILIGEDEEKDKLENFASEIFSIQKPAAATDTTTKKSDRTKKTEETKVEPQPRRTDIVRIERETDGTGFSVVPAKDLEQAMIEQETTFPIRIEVTAAYLSVRGNNRSFRDYARFDFDFSKNIKTEIEPEEAVKILASDGNKLSFEIYAANFRVRSTGFDLHRDLLIRTKITS